MPGRHAFFAEPGAGALAVGHGQALGLGGVGRGHRGGGGKRQAPAVAEGRAFDGPQDEAPGDFDLIESDQKAFLGRCVESVLWCVRSLGCKGCADCPWLCVAFDMSCECDHRWQSRELRPQYFGPPETQKGVLSPMLQDPRLARLIRTGSCVASSKVGVSYF